jgi:hypothetical protein
MASDAHTIYLFMPIYCFLRCGTTWTKGAICPIFGGVQTAVSAVAENSGVAMQGKDCIQELGMIVHACLSANLSTNIACTRNEMPK